MDLCDEDDEPAEAADGAAFPPAELVEECVLAVLTPAALVTWHPLHPLMLFDRHGHELVAARFVRLTRARIARVWAEQIPGFHPTRWRAAVRLLGAGPSLACLLRRRQTNAVSASEGFAALKGPSEPAHLRPDHLRWQLGAVNKLNNLLHSADTSAKTVRELAIVLGSDQAEAAWRAAAAPRVGSTEVLANALQSAAPIVLRPTGASFAHAAVAARHRAFSGFGALLPARERARIGRCLDAESAYVRESSPRLGARLLGAPFAGSAIPATVERPLDARTTRAVLIFNALGDALTGRPSEIRPGLGRAMRELELSRWDEVLIESQLAAQHA